MRRYNYVTVFILVCGFSKDDYIYSLVSPVNPLKTIHNMIDENGKVLVRAEIVFGYSSKSTFVYEGDKGYLICYAVERYQLRLPYPMTREELEKFIVEKTGIKYPPKTLYERFVMIEKLYEELRMLKK